ncbi:nitroreductase [Pseudomonas fluorescens]|uniref:Nitroreductase n=1 Tax=Pseudomonas fluorescens TaxID=294 RepID=A0A1T2Y2M6_PSEFL|nr:nitroreductase [Pseudomonas fluorescens]OPA86272.1 nitroreductase [Pseudomonas fluorescens]
MSQPELFQDIARSRRVTRQFLPTPLSERQINRVLLDAQHSPSNCNTQPWHVHLVSGDTRDRLSAALLAADDRHHFTPDFEFDMAAYTGVFAERAQASGRARYEAIDIGRDDHAARQACLRHNLKFFDAPHVAFLFMPQISDYVRAAGDIGMYAQTFLLSLHARGFGAIPQTLLGMYADTVRDVLGVSVEMKLMFGISFGYADQHSASNFVDVGRVALEESVVRHS